MFMRIANMQYETRSTSPTVMLRISDGSREMRRAFADFGQAIQSAEAYAGAGFMVDVVSATGLFLMGFEPRWQGLAV
jgi:hypothetical protein